MRRALFLLTAAVGAVAVPAVGATDSTLDFQSAVAALEAVDPTIAPPPNGPGKDSAVGGFHGVGTAGVTTKNNVGFSAESGSLGQDPQGHLSDTEPHFFPTSPNTRHGRFRVICLAVLGNQAAVGLVPTDTASNDESIGEVLAVQDSGLPGGMGDTYAFLPEPPAMCAFSVGDAILPIERGNIHVHDAP